MVTIHTVLLDIPMIRAATRCADPGKDGDKGKKQAQELVWDIR